jgi:hypothetical protein
VRIKSRFAASDFQSFSIPTCRVSKRMAHDYTIGDLNLRVEIGIGEAALRPVFTPTRMSFSISRCLS